MISGGGLLVAGHLLIAYSAKGDLVLEGADIVAGTGVGHVGDSETAVSGRNVGASHIGYFSKGDAACRIQDHQCDLFTGDEGHGLLIVDLAVGTANRNRMEAVGYI